MAAMTTALTEFSTLGDSRTYVMSSHTVSDPRLVLQKRKVPSGNKKVQESTVTVLYGTEDANNEPLPQKVAFMASAAYPVGCTAADVTAALATFRDIVASDEFGTMVTTQKWLK